MEETCVLCGISSPDEPIKTCEGCQSNFHQACWDENGGCATNGCPFAPKMENKQNEPLEQTYWGARTKDCPMCGETIEIYKLICPFCHEQFDSIEPITSEDIKRKFTKSQVPVKEKKGAILVFIFGLLGITAPLNLIFGGLWYKKNKKKLRKISPVHNLLAKMGLYISVIYSILFFFSMAFD